jgi:flagellar motor switch protein FliM
MSENLLNPDEIAALFDPAADGKPSVESPKRGTHRARWLRTIDWSRPTKFSLDQENRLRRAHEAVCRTVMTRLAAEHRIDLELEIIDVTQHTWDNALRLVPKESMCATLHADPIETSLLLGVELPFLSVSLERLLGSAADAMGHGRKLTDIDLRLLRRVFDVLAASLSVTWGEMAQVGFTCGAIEARSEVGQLVAFSEPTLAIVMEARLEGTTSTLVLLLPHASVAPVAAAYSKRVELGTGRDDATALALRAGLGSADVTLRAEVGGVTLPLQRVLALRPGDVIELGAGSGGEVDLCAADVAVHRAKAGRTRRARAVQILGPAERAS